MKKIIALIAALLLLSSTATAEQKAFVILANREGRLNVRTSPEGEIIARLYDGEDVMILDRIPGWALVRHFGAESPLGWVSDEYLHAYGPIVNEEGIVQ